MGNKEPVSGIVLITGGFGYLGGRIAVAVQHDGDHRVRLASRRQRSMPAWLPEAEVAALDLLDPGTFEPALNGVRAVVHLAAVNEVDSLADPDKAFLVNTQGTAHLLEACIQTGVERFIYFSTAHIYGAPLIGHITECCVPRPVHPYASSHFAAEKFVLAAHEAQSLTGIVLRLSNGFGAPTHVEVNRWMLLVNDLCRQVVRDRKIVLRSSGMQRRDFITLQDVGRIVNHFLGLPREACANGLFNAGGECSMTAWAMAQRVRQCCREVLGYEPDILRPEPLPDEPAGDLSYDISKLKGTGFVPEGDMDEEIRQTLKMCVFRQKGRTA